MMSEQRQSDPITDKQILEQAIARVGEQRLEINELKTSVRALLGALRPFANLADGADKWFTDPGKNAEAPLYGYLGHTVSLSDFRIARDLHTEISAKLSLLSGEGHNEKETSNNGRS